MESGKTCQNITGGLQGARNTGADARVVALLRQLDKVTDPEKVSFTVMTLSTEHVNGYFSSHVRLLPFSTFFFFSLLKAASTHHVAVLCEGSTLTRTFADATILPQALGLPPILTIMALAKRIAKIILD